MSIKLISLNAAKLATALLLVTSVSLTSCGNKDAANTTTDAAKTATDAAKTAEDAAKTAGDAAKTAGGAADDAAKSAASTGAPLSAAEKAQLTPVKVALVGANTAVKTGDMTKAKTQFDKFSGLWTTVKPMVKAKAGASYPAIESGINMVKTAMSGAAPDKAKAGEGLNMAIKGIDAVMNKK
jgi:hypothetical protein